MQSSRMFNSSISQTFAAATRHVYLSFFFCLCLCLCACVLYMWYCNSETVVGCIYLYIYVVAVNNVYIRQNYVRARFLMLLLLGLLFAAHRFCKLSVCWWCALFLIVRLVRLFVCLFTRSLQMVKAKVWKKKKRKKNEWEKFNITFGKWKLNRQNF